MTSKPSPISLIFRAIEVNRKQVIVTKDNVEQALPTSEKVQEILRQAGHNVPIREINAVRGALTTGFNNPIAFARLGLADKTSEIAEGCIKRMKNGTNPPGTRHTKLDAITPRRTTEEKTNNGNGHPSKLEIRKWIMAYVRGEKLPQNVMKHFTNALGVARKTKLEQELLNKIQRRRILKQLALKRYEEEQSAMAMRMNQVRARHAEGLKRVVEYARETPSYRGPRRRR